MPKKPRKLSRAQIAKRFRDRNRRFKALDTKKQRIKILKDVVALLESKKILAKSDNTYLDVKYDNCSDDSNKTQLHEVVETNKCTVCGIGGIFVSAVLLKNKLKVGDLLSGDPSHIEKYEMAVYLRKWFREDQLDLIEDAFEATTIYGGNNPNAHRFGRKYRTDKARLIAICKNMIANGGKFVPPSAEKERSVRK